MQELADHPELVSIYRRKAQDRVQRLFNWEDVTAAHKRVYETVLSTKPQYAFDSVRAGAKAASHRDGD